MKKTMTTLAALLLAATAAPAFADDAAPYTITFKDGGFEPKAFEVPADQRVILEIVNAEDVAIEFESDDMKAEKIIAAGKTRKVMVGPLPAGAYEYFNEFNMNAGTGVVTAK